MPRQTFCFLFSLQNTWIPGPVFPFPSSLSLFPPSFATTHLALQVHWPLASSHAFPLLLRNEDKFCQIICSLCLMSISGQSGTRGNGTFARLSSHSNSQATAVASTLFLQLVSRLCITIFWLSRRFSSLFWKGFWKLFLLRNAVSCIRLSVCFSRASEHHAATALHPDSAKYSLLKPRWEGWGGELNDYNASGMWAIYSQ